MRPPSFCSSGPTVKAILCQRFGTPDDLVLGDISDPTPAPGEVVAKVVAVGLNFFDTLIIAGKYQTKPPFPFSPGGEFAGVVESVGAGVAAFARGDRVMGYTNFNAARERTAVPADNIVKIPADLDFDRAAALARLGRPPSRRRLRRRGYPEAAAQSRPAQGLCRARGILGRVGAPRARAVQGGDRAAGTLVRRGQAVRPHPAGLSLERNAESAQGARRAQGDGQTDRAAVKQQLG